MGKSSRDKGKRGEREVASLLQAEGFAARTGRQHRGGPDSPDVIVDDLPWLHIEVKRTERFSLYPALDQAKRDAGEGQVPAVYHRKSRARWAVVVGAEDFAKLIRKYEPPSDPRPCVFCMLAQCKDPGGPDCDARARGIEAAYRRQERGAER